MTAKRILYGLVLAWCFAAPAHAAAPVKAPPPAGFASRHLGATLALGPDVFDPTEAETYVLPFMQAHPALFKGKTVMDIGTGSGIIALYAAKLGAKKVIATDISREALACAQANAKKLGFDKIIETRLVPMDKSGAYTVLKRGEKFDAVISNPPYVISEDAPAGSAILEKGDLGVSIIDGLKDRLNQGGYAVLLYRSTFSQQVMANRAWMHGYDSRYHDSDRITAIEINTIYNAYLKDFMKRYGKPSDMKFNLRTIPMPQPASPPPLVDGDKPGVLYPGLIVIKLRK